MVLCRIASTDFVNVLDKDRRTAIMCAVMGRKNDILKVLVQFGADVTLKVTFLTLNQLYEHLLTNCLYF